MSLSSIVKLLFYNSNMNSQESVEDFLDYMQHSYNLGVEDVEVCRRIIEHVGLGSEGESEKKGNDK